MDNKKKAADSRLDTLREMTARENVVDTVYYFGADRKELPIRVTRSIPFSEYGAMVQSIASALWDGDAYLPHMGFVKRLYVYFNYTDLPLGEMDADLCRTVCMDDELFRFVTGLIFDDMHDLDGDVDELVAWEQRRKLNRSSNELFDTAAAFFAHLDTLLSKAEEGLKVPDGRSHIDLQALVKAMEAVGSKDEGEIVKAVLREQQEHAAAKPKKRSVKKTPDIELVVTGGEK